MAVCEDIAFVPGFALLLRVELAGIFFAYSRNESTRCTRSTVPVHIGPQYSVPKSGRSIYMGAEHVGNKLQDLLVVGW